LNDEKQKNYYLTFNQNHIYIAPSHQTTILFYSKKKRKRQNEFKQNISGGFGSENVDIVTQDFSLNS
jgi:hypothetical protein